MAILDRLTGRKKNAGISRTVFQSLAYIGIELGNMADENMRVMRRHFSLFFGIAVLIAGVFSFSSNRYCDGSITDSLACTRPTTYYYYEPITILIIVIGVFAVLLWFLKRRQNER